MEGGNPRQIGRYRVLRQLGKGSMGVVYEAHDPALDRIIALKTINLSFALSGEARQQFEDRFFSEARISARLSHPGIVAVHDAGRDPESGLLYIALERLAGSTLAEIQLPLAWREALRLTHGVAEALDYAHACGIVHRDIKPANIMRLRTGETKLMDFGIAQIESARSELSGAGQLFGTPLYMAPELALGRKLDARADLFSLGTVCYALLTGRQAFAADNIPAIVARIAHLDPAPPSSVVAEIPVAVDELIAHVLAKKPDRRHASARALAEDLEDVLAGRRARHGASRGADRLLQEEGSTLAEDTLKLDLEQLLARPDPGRPPAAPAEYPLASLLPENTGTVPPATLRPSWRGASRRRVSALAAAFVVGALHMLPRLGVESPASALPQKAPSPAPGARIADPKAVAGDQTPPARSAELPPSASAASWTPELAGEVAPPARSAWLLVDFKHPVERARLRLWVGGKMTLDERLSGQVEKRLKLIKVREGELEETLELAPGRHQIKVAVNWDDNEKTESISGLFREGQAKHLEIRLGRLRKNLSLDWR